MARKAEKISLIRTSAATNSKGFTLIEVLIALVLVALFSVIAVPTFNSVFRTGSQSFAIQTASLMRDARDRALLNKSVVRVRWDLDKQQYWAEEGPDSLLIPKETKEKLSDEEKKKVEEESPFRLLREITPQHKTLPYGVKITQLVLPRKKDPVKEGIADIYFFPNGTGGGAIISLEDFDKRTQSLWVHPLTGSSRIRPGLLTKDEEFNE
jgi:prepilin-type N-terminal cleavage/methylation domain-containing protein